MKSSALREARLERMWTQEHVAKIAGVAVRTLRDYEAGDPIGRLSAIEYIAKALGVEPKQIARAVTEEERAGAKATPPSSGAPSAPLHRPEPGVTHLPPQTRLEELVVLERDHPRPTLPGTAWGELQPFGARTYQDLFTAYRVHEGLRAWCPVFVDQQRGMGVQEARLLGTESGIGGRFQLTSEVAPGHILAITVHTTNAAHTKALQAALHTQVRVVVSLFLVPKDAIARREGLSFFFNPTSPRAWGLVVDDVLPPEPVVLKNRKGAAKEKSVAKKTSAKKSRTTS